ncbi:MAG: D-alanyl-D-alanine carboxypeptidase [Clostridia bacterium]|nr:D-alanyl-D-alanine carboxypeptidase [Clostridia bacterium]
MFKKISLFCVFAVLFALTGCFSAAAADRPIVSAKSAVVYCVNNGEVLYAENARERLPMASTTKILSALLACESGQLSREITVTNQMAAVEGSSMGLLPGDRVTLRGLIYGMLLDSGNDAANTAAIALCGNTAAFAELMNRRAAEIGMEDSHFVNPSGLPDDAHYSTAYDMAILTAEALRNDVFAEVCRTQTAVVWYGNPPYRRVLTNHNRLLKEYEDCIGVKTGFTKKAGRCLVSAAARDGITLIAVTLNDPDDWADHRTLLEYGFSLCASRRFTPDVAEAAVTVTGGEKTRLSVTCVGQTVLVDGGEASAVSAEILAPRFLYAPVQKGDIVGSVVIYDGATEVGRLPLIAAESVAVSAPKQEKPSVFSAIKDFLKGLFR